MRASGATYLCLCARARVAKQAPPQHRKWTHVSTQRRVDVSGAQIGGHQSVDNGRQCRRRCCYVTLMKRNDARFEPPAKLRNEQDGATQLTRANSRDKAHGTLLLAREWLRGPRRLYRRRHARRRTALFVCCARVTPRSRDDAPPRLQVAAQRDARLRRNCVRLNGRPPVARHSCSVLALAVASSSACLASVVANFLIIIIMLDQIRSHTRARQQECMRGCLSRARASNLHASHDAPIWEPCASFVRAGKRCADQPSEREQIKGPIKGSRMGPHGPRLIAHDRSNNAHAHARAQIISM